MFLLLLKAPSVFSVSVIWTVFGELFRAVHCVTLKLDVCVCVCLRGATAHCGMWVPIVSFMFSHGCICTFFVFLVNASWLLLKCLGCILWRIEASNPHISEAKNSKYFEIWHFCLNKRKITARDLGPGSILVSICSPRSFDRSRLSRFWLQAGEQSKSSNTLAKMCELTSLASSAFPVFDP